MRGSQVGLRGCRSQRECDRESLGASYNLVASRSIAPPPRLTRDLRYNQELSGPVHSPLCKKEACPITCNLSHTSMYLVPGCDVPRCGLTQGVSSTALYIETVFSLVQWCERCVCGCVCGILTTANSLLRFTLSLNLGLLLSLHSPDNTDNVASEQTLVARP